MNDVDIDDFTSTFDQLRNQIEKLISVNIKYKKTINKLRYELSTIKKDTNKQENTEPVSAPLVQVQEIEDVDQEINESEQFQEVPQEKLSNHSSSLYSSIESSIPLPPRDSSDPKISQDQQMSSWRKVLIDSN